MKSRGKKQKAELRIVLKKDGQTALAWQASLDGDHLYAGGAKQGDHETFRFSYHADGKTHFYTGGSRTVTGRKPKLTEISGLHRLPTWNPDAPSMGYVVKPDSAHRRTLVLEPAQPGMPFVVDLWFVGPELLPVATTEVLKQKPYTYASAEVMGTVAADWTNPRIVAVAWKPETRFWAKVAPQLPPATSPASTLWVDRVGYRYDPVKGLESVKLPDP